MEEERAQAAHQSCLASLVTLVSLTREAHSGHVARLGWVVPVKHRPCQPCGSGSWAALSRTAPAEEETVAWWEVESQMVRIEPSPEPEFVEEESSRRSLEDRQDRRMTPRRRLACNRIVSGLINEVAMSLNSVTLMITLSTHTR